MAWVDVRVIQYAIIMQHLSDNILKKPRQIGIQKEKLVGFSQDLWFDFIFGNKTN